MAYTTSLDGKASSDAAYFIDIGSSQRPALYIYRHNNKGYYAN